MDIQYAADKLPEEERVKFVIEKMKAIESDPDTVIDRRRSSDKPEQ